MRTRRVRRAIYKIDRLLISDEVKEDSELWKSWNKFKKLFMKEYAHQMLGGNQGRKRMRFRSSKKL